MKTFHVLVWLVLAVAVPAQTDIVAVSWIGTASAIDSATGTGTALGPSGYSGLNSMARDPLTGTIYTFTTNAGGVILEVDPTTGVATPNGVTLPLSDIRGLAFDSSGAAWAIAQGSSDQLWSVDLVGGTAILVGATGFNSIQSLAADPFTGNLYAWDIAAGTGPQNLVMIDKTTGVGTTVGAGQPMGNIIQALAFSPSGVLYGARDSLYTVDLATGAFTLVGTGGYTDVRGFEFTTSAPPGPTYAGNGSDVAIQVGVNGVPQVSPTGIHVVNAGDVVSLAFVSPGGGLAFQPFLAFWQVFTTGSPPSPQSALGIHFDPLIPNGIIADGLSNPNALLNPVLDVWVAAGTIPPTVAGANLSILVNCLAADPSIPPLNLGVAEAQEIQIN